VSRTESEPVDLHAYWSRRTFFDVVQPIFSIFLVSPIVVCRAYLPSLSSVCLPVCQVTVRILKHELSVLYIVVA